MSAFGEPLPDNCGELRLQLMHAQDQRDAFKALGHRDVLALIREAFKDASVVENGGEVLRLRAENSALKAAVESHERVDCLAVERLKAEVERLRKAGDAMHRAIKVSDPILDWKIELWNAAKDGKQS